ncbi:MULTISPECIES: hypothetical protein [Streptomyces]|jgi:hypothetical protein|uniref:hypothetical protein n=1 Tax=Streptomyces TaxID=1883 RepID=UPI0019043470|nr:MULTISPECIES: hypothetical protein [unclassified Streptomyces]MCU4748562.1 hypothetical protein [Streptomyces sp. G-5]QQN79076.1 hypothetical protein IPZ77_17785 [Streptomyces sp. XC 2026]
MGIGDQFKDKAQELQQRAKDAMNKDKDEQDQNKNQDQNPERGRQQNSSGQDQGYRDDQGGT